MLVGEEAVERGGGVVDGAGHCGLCPLLVSRRSQLIGSPWSTSWPAGAQHLAGQLAAVGGVGQHVRDHAAHHEALGRVAERVDQPVVPGAAAVEVAHGREPARRDGLVPREQRGGVVVGVAAGKSVPSIAASQTSLLQTWCSSTAATDSSAPSQLEHRGARQPLCRGRSRPAGPWPGRAGPGCRRGRAATICSVSGFIGCSVVCTHSDMGGWKWIPLGAGSQCDSAGGRWVGARRPGRRRG